MSYRLNDVVFAYLFVGWWSFSSGFSSYFSLASFLAAFVLLGVARAIFVCRVAEIAFRSAISAGADPGIAGGEV